MANPVPAQNQAEQVVCFHDGDCPICELEINFMKKIDKRKAIQWVDINKDKAALDQAGITYQQAMDQIHVMDANGMKQGVDGFVLIWQELARAALFSTLGAAGEVASHWCAHEAWLSALCKIPPDINGQKSLQRGLVAKGPDRANAVRKTRCVSR